MEVKLDDIELPCSLNDFQAHQTKQAALYTTTMESDWHKATLEGFNDAVQVGGPKVQDAAAPWEDEEDEAGPLGP